MKRFLVTASASVWLLTAASAVTAIPAEVKIDSGTIAGTTGASAEVRVFKGVPYAAAPVGANRWRAPQPVAAWSGTRSATEFSPRCTQGGGARPATPAATPGAAPAAAPAAPAPQPTSEDCLYLNVWTTAAAAEAKQPVMLWLYGGGFFSGAGSEPRYGGEGLSKKGAVVVTINYRLGSLGFFAHPDLSAESDHKVSSNYGMLDALAALQWVKRNIAKFGGDPNNVTVFGESAGGNLTAALVASPAAKGLFQHAIMQSGGYMGLAMARLSTLATAEAAGAKALTDAGAKSIAELRAKPVQEVFNAIRGGNLVVDGQLLPEDPSLVFTQSKQNSVDVLIGSNQDEGTFFPRPDLTAEQFSSGAKQKFGVLADQYLKIYPATDDTQAATSYLTSFRDEASWHMRRFAALQSKVGKKTYVYYFTRVPPPPAGRPSRGATHVAEVPYMFNNLPPDQPWTDVDKKLADTMSSYWVNFARTGDPNGAGLPTWPTYRDNGTGKAQVLGDAVTTEAATSTPPAPTLAFFDQAYEQLLKGGAPR